LFRNPFVESRGAFGRRFRINGLFITGHHETLLWPYIGRSAGADDKFVNLEKEGLKCMHFDCKKDPKEGILRSAIEILNLEASEMLEKMEPAIRVERTTC
jgi:hypothetical protein